MSNNRTFEVGDMVITGLDRPAIITSVGSIFISTDLGNFYPDSIRCVRKPLPGCDEARAIVAMLAREHHKILLRKLALWKELDNKEDNLRQRIDDYWLSRKRGDFDQTTYLYYQKAKAMLK